MALASAHDAQVELLKVPPHSVEAEQSVLGGLLLDNTAWDKIGDVIGEQDFYRGDHRSIYRAIAKLIEQSRPADVITVAESLESTKDLQSVGGMAYLSAVATATPSAANIRRYAEIVRERAILRKLAEVAANIADSAYSPMGRDAAQILDEAESRVFEIAEQGARGRQGFQDMPPLLTQVVERIDMLYNRGGDSDVTGVATGFVDLDRMTSGLQPGDLVIVAGRPSMGKTSLAMNIAEHAALHSGLPVGVFSMEMAGTQLVMRMLGSVGRLDQHKLRTGRLHDEDWTRLTHAVGKLNDAPIHVDETPALNSLELRSRARRLHRQYRKLGLIVVDYLQLMSASSQGENRATEISEISRSLKALAKELHCPVIALSQLNRSLEQRPNKRPVMSDLRECVTGDTRVLLTDGRRVPIRELVGAQPEVWAMSPQRRIVPARSDRVWSVGVRPVLRITLASGRVLRATAKHRVYGAKGWVRAGELRQGDVLAVSASLPPSVARNQCCPSPSPLAGEGGGEGEAYFSITPRVLPPAVTWPRAVCLQMQQQTSSALAFSAEIAADSIVRIEPDGEEEVFDLTVPGPASWLADGIVSHNSGAIEQDADLILFIYRDEVYNPDTADKGIAEVIVGKQRNGPIGTVRLAFLGEFTRFENLADSSRY
jgi:replicative DNA helicase